MPSTFHTALIILHFPPLWNFCPFKESITKIILSNVPFSESNTTLSVLFSTAGVNALLADQTQSRPQQEVQQLNPGVQPPPFEAHPHHHHPTLYIPAPYHQEKAPRLLSPHVETEEEHHDDDQFDQPNQSQLDHDARNVRMDGSESGGWRREWKGCEDVWVEEWRVDEVWVKRGGRECKYSGWKEKCEDIQLDEGRWSRCEYALPKLPPAFVFLSVTLSIQ